MYSSLAAVRAKVAGLNLAFGSRVLGFGRVMQMSDHTGLVNQRIRMQRSQSEETTTQSQEISRQARYDEKYYRPVCYRERVYERTWPEYEVEKEYEEPTKPDTDPRNIEELEELDRWNEVASRNREELRRPKGTKRHNSQSRRDEWAEFRKRSR
ncbi:uncharacterized protein LOC111080143 [Drosophila obscura]|uniref:uncharacterized protein LOC111080143 n=1 Tax=Drosophila obscura TaxID=7282 RepID=UPI001BB2BA65|nr:uncharacterized protein LOC111080143 [Drosophila obscura]